MNVAAKNVAAKNAAAKNAAAKNLPSQTLPSQTLPSQDFPSQRSPWRIATRQSQPNSTPGMARRVSSILLVMLAARVRLIGLPFDLLSDDIGEPPFVKRPVLSDII
ncbi:MAG: hypothetical protein ACLQFW_10870 [Xanthobacteraceae bacterium]